MMASYSGKGAPSNGSVYICNLPPGTDEDMLAEYFGTIGLLKVCILTGHSLNLSLLCGFAVINAILQYLAAADKFVVKCDF